MPGQCRAPLAHGVSPPTCCPRQSHHVVFTLPAPFSAIAWYDKAVIYGLLFDIAAKTLRIIATAPRHLGTHIGATLALPTWGSALTHHPHVHGIVPGGGLSARAAIETAAHASASDQISPPHIPLQN